MFEWCDALGLGSAIDAARAAVSSTVRLLPKWLLFSLPNALWTYSFTTFMLYYWRRRLSWESAPWIALGPTLGVGWEVGQSLGLIPGTFDATDLLFVLFAVVVALVVMRPVFEARR